MTIPKGVAVIVPIALLQKSPKYWKDPETFNPDRYVFSIETELEGTYVDAETGKASSHVIN